MFNDFGEWASIQPDVWRKVINQSSCQVRSQVNILRSEQPDDIIFNNSFMIPQVMSQ